MKKLIVSVLFLVMCVCIYANELSEREPDWWKDAGLGIFFHIGPYSCYEGEYKGRPSPGTAEWIQSQFWIKNSEYEETAKTFNPVKFDADQWVRRAKDAGAQYIVFTSKHHDGFANFRTDFSDYSLWNYQHKDMVRDIARACEKYNMRFGIYYSHNVDWHEKDGGANDPQLHKKIGWCPSNQWDFPPGEDKDYDVNRYFESKAFPQIKELLTNYGKVDIMWFDLAYGITEEQAKKFYDIVKGIQPDCLICSRICFENFKYADYHSLADNTTAKEPTENRSEACITLNDTWGYSRLDNNWKSWSWVLHTLAKSVALNSNICLNVGPKPDGSWPEETIKVFSEMADWMKINKESIHGNRPVFGVPVNDDYVFTKKGKTVYLHFLKDMESVDISEFNTKAKSIKVLGNRYKIKWSQNRDDYIIHIDCYGKTDLSVLKIVFND
ncbi:MAG: alpha-L-fucosidase [Armatimonadetes bacterium]|nr:alpha-L-fucosidase [Candidatus Hippobium faecium]